MSGAGKCGELSCVCWGVGGGEGWREAEGGFSNLSPDCLPSGQVLRPHHFE